MWLYYTTVKEIQLWLCEQSLDSQPLIQGSYLDTMATFCTGHNAVTFKNVIRTSASYSPQLLSGCKCYVHSADITTVHMQKHAPVLLCLYIYLPGVENLMKSAVQ